MPWSKKQKALAVQSCRAAGIGDEHRKLILRQTPNAVNKRTGEPSSTSSRLDDRDFEQFMAIVERASGGTIKGYAPAYWTRSADDYLQRMRCRARRHVCDLVAAGKLADVEQSLRGWIRNRVCKGEHKPLEALDYDELRALICGLQAYARQESVRDVAKDTRTAHAGV